MLCNPIRAYNVTCQDSLPGSSGALRSRTIQVRICFGNDEAGGFVELLLKSCLPREGHTMGLIFSTE